jgi:hypothetical protein
VMKAVFRRRNLKTWPRWMASRAIKMSPLIILQQDL